ncbi:hypothetical protein E8E12_007608 [Didymella heteroderae]|uniref:tRNA/rRNA methyltransferase SpoU type domain-containing protein n=1 Tax=Didymella heteroderae TaxID=1769908 RepID=A0A9P4WV70_9PLEO|nr:hypothetical protein E8E12_007608 [Didymella heteroderae]
MDDAILYMSDELKLKAFELNWAKLEASTTHLNIDTVGLCVRLLPELSDGSRKSHEKLRDLLVRRVREEEQDSQYLYQLAEACSHNASFAELFYASVHQALLDAAPWSHPFAQKPDQELEVPAEERTRQAAAFLTFLKCSYWLPPGSLHVVRPGILRVFMSCVDKEGLTEPALDALSALLALSSSKEPIQVPSFGNFGTGALWARLDALAGRYTLDGSLVYLSFWSHLKTLSPALFETKASKLYKVWFQWISQMANAGIHPDDGGLLYGNLYWDRVRTGLLTGFADQRKYCLGIIRASLLVAGWDIDTHTMCMEVERRDAYIKAYDRYFILYETIVLDRYANQIEACLPELSALFGSQSVVTASMATTLLSSGLDPQVQEGIRKIIGNWYFTFMSGAQSPLDKDPESLNEHTKFLVRGFLPWATQGSLFTATLKANRTTIECSHGAALVKLVARFVTSKFADEKYREHLLVSILKFVLDAEGKMFQMSTLYLLEGLIAGFDMVSSNGEPIRLTQQAINDVLRISRTPGLPEIATDLYKVYCRRLCEFAAPDVDLASVPGYDGLRSRVEQLDATEVTSKPISSASGPTTLTEFLETLRETKHTSIQGSAYTTACTQLAAFLDASEPASINSDELHAVLDAMWEEADRREFNRSVVIHLPTLLFHPVCIQVCLKEHTSEDASPSSLRALLTKAVETLQQLSEGRSYILAIFASSLRRAAFSYPAIIEVLPYEDVIIRFLNHPPVAKSEFLFEVTAADKLERYIPHRTYGFYYGRREWHAYAAWIDLLNRFPQKQKHVAQRVFDKLLEPWAGQKGTVPVIAKWKNVFQLQAMLVLVEHCVSETDADAYLDKFMHALTVEQWPRFRFVLEWVITRIYFHHPKKADRILKDLAHLDESSPIHIASLMKLAVLTAPFLDSEEFALNLIIQLIPFSASQKVHIRHEAHLSFPMIYELAERKGWKDITANPGFSVLNAHIRQTEKFNTPAWSIRTLRIDAVADFTLTEIFQGQYLYIETPEPERVAHDDFVALADAGDSTALPIARIALGSPRAQTAIPVNPKPAEYVFDEDGVKSNFYQTKSGFDFTSLLPAPGAPHLQDKQPASVILIASLIDNPTNLGGLSRISESFGLETLYINDIKKTAHKDFKATSVTSEKHLPIKELREANVPAFIAGMKRKGYEIVGIEQTDRSGVLGDEEKEGSKDVGTLPRRCIQPTAEIDASRGHNHNHSNNYTVSTTMPDTNTLP